MKRAVPLLFFLFLFIGSYGQESNDKISIIPKPAKLDRSSGDFNLPKEVTIKAPSRSDVKKTVKILKERLSQPTGHKVNVVDQSSSKADIHLKLNKDVDSVIGKEGYYLTVTPEQIDLEANKPAGLFYGVQTLLQLFPKEIEDNSLVKDVTWQIPAVEITDYPRFGWRGLMFDVSRHFFTKAEVKQFIDQMVRYKYNLLHFHLTDDQGWRIEIKGLPKLTKVGAWNVKKLGYFGTFSDPDPDAPRDYGGFYTQKDIKEIVKYAQERFVDIMPEIDVPGHSLAAVSAYPELSCTPEAKNYHPNSGQPFTDFSQGGHPIAKIDNTLCPAKEEVYEFLDKVLTQIADLFPFKYIHMGGDEAPHNFWKKTPEIKKLMKKEGLENMNEVQSYFTKRVEKIVESKGKRLMGWDEILEGGLAPNAAVMSWRGMKGGKEAAKKKHEVVMTPTDYAYLDYMQGDPFVEPNVYGTLLLSKAYQFEPVPEGVDPKYILGGQGNLWTEQIYKMRHVEYMLWPRAMAISEVLWSPKDKRHWKDFFSRVEHQFKRLDEAKIKYAPSVYDPWFKPHYTDDDKLKIKLDTELNNLDIYYSFDNSFPDKFYPKYKDPLTPPEDAVMFRVVTYKGDKQVGRIISVSIKDLKDRADKENED